MTLSSDVTGSADVTDVLDVTRAEVCAVAISDLFVGAGEILASPTGLVPQLGARLARLTHAPELMLSDGEATMFADTPAIDEPFTEPEHYLPYRALFDLIARGKRHVVMGGSQLDQYGNHNFSAIGNWQRPSHQLLGARAAATNTANHAVSYWIPRHAPRVFVPAVDTVCGAGSVRLADARFADLRRVVTNLAVLDFSGPGGTMALVSVHPGVSVAEVAAATGFDLHIADEVPTTRLPTAGELALIRERLDPRNARYREVPR